MKPIFKYINAKAMFEDYMPGIPCRYLKMRGRDPHNRPMYFSDEEKKYILEAINKMAKDLLDKYAEIPVKDIYK